jgi:hypothetical protein
MTTGRKCKRKDARKRIAYQLSRSEIVKAVPSAETVQELALAIVGNKLAAFGITKLSTLDLNGVYDFSGICQSLKCENDNGHNNITNNNYISTCTLLRLAAGFGRDGIISAIIWSGANPGAQICPSSRSGVPGADDPQVQSDAEGLGQLIRKRMRKCPPSYNVWVCRVLFQLQSEFCSSEIMRSDCQFCHCSSCQQQRRADSPQCAARCLFQFPGCNHIVCENQYWRKFVASASFESVSCPVCSRSLEHFELCPSLFSLETDLTLPYGVAARLAQGHRMEEEPSLNWGSDELIVAVSKVDSYSKWSMLPQTLLQLEKVPKRPRLIARSLNEIASLYAGATQEARNNEVLLACRKGDTRRLRALYYLGTHIDAQDEYGHTPMFAACWLNMVGVVKVLLQMKADPAVGDNCGISPLQLCRLLGHSECASLLTESISLSATEEFADSRIYGPRSEYAGDIFSRFCPPGDSIAKLLSQAQENGLAPRVEILIPFDSTHPGAGALIADNVLSDQLLDFMVNIFHALPVAPPEKLTCSHRSYYGDASGVVRHILHFALKRIHEELVKSGLTGYSDSTTASIVASNEHNEMISAARSRDCRDDEDEEPEDFLDSEDAADEVNAGSKNSFSYCSEALPQMRFLHVSRSNNSLFDEIVDIACLFSI